jgi:phage terminase large subunit
LSAQTRQIDLPEYAADLWAPFRHLAWYGGRGGGKSFTIATGLILQSMERHERVLCGRELQKSIRDSSKRLLDDAIDRLGVRAAFQSTDNEIRGPNDSLFLFSGIKGNANGIKSTEGVTTFWGDEAQAFSQSSIDTVIPTIRKPGSRLIWTWNPDLRTDPVDNLFRGEATSADGRSRADGFTPPPQSIVREVNFNDNPWFPDVLRVEMEYDRSRDVDKFNHIWRGQYRANSEARVFRNWRVEDFESDLNAEYRQGADFGFSIDPSCLVRCYIKERVIYVDHEAWGLGVEIVNLPELFMSIPDAEKWWTTADSSRPETISHLRNHGFPRIRSAIKGARSVEEGVEFLKSYDIVVHPRCQHLIDELGLYSYKTDSLTGQVLPVLADKDNHMIDALRYSVEGARRAIAAAPTMSVPVTIPAMATAFNRR